MFDAIQFRGRDQATVEELAAATDVPVYNGLTDTVAPDPDAGGLPDDAEHAGRRRRGTS